jgi:hypothetical protein
MEKEEGEKEGTLVGLRLRVKRRERAKEESHPLVGTTGLKV